MWSQNCSYGFQPCQWIRLTILILSASILVWSQQTYGGIPAAHAYGAAVAANDGEHGYDGQAHAAGGVPGGIPDHTQGYRQPVYAATPDPEYHVQQQLQQIQGVGGVNQGVAVHPHPSIATRATGQQNHPVYPPNYYAQQRYGAPHGAPAAAVNPHHPHMPAQGHIQQPIQIPSGINAGSQHPVNSGNGSNIGVPIGAGGVHPHNNNNLSGINTNNGGVPVDPLLPQDSNNTQGITLTTIVFVLCTLLGIYIFLSCVFYALRRHQRDLQKKNDDPTSSETLLKHGTTQTVNGGFYILRFFKTWCNLSWQRKRPVSKYEVDNALRSNGKTVITPMTYYSRTL